MPTLQQQIADSFLAKLTNSEGIDAAQVEELRRILAEGKKPKAEDFIKVFTTPAGEDLK